MSFKRRPTKDDFFNLYATPFPRVRTRTPRKRMYAFSIHMCAPVALPYRMGAVDADIKLVDLCKSKGQSNLITFSRTRVCSQLYRRPALGVAATAHSAFVSVKLFLKKGAVFPVRKGSFLL